MPVDQIVLNDFNTVLRILGIYCEDKSQAFEELYELYAGIDMTRNLHPKTSIPKSKAIMDMIWSYEEKEFKIIARMSKLSFVHVLHLIANYHVFQSISSTSIQAT